MPFTRHIPIIASSAVFDPATLSLTGWWRANSTTQYQNSTGTWTGTASAGGSGSRNLTQATSGQRPADGTALNGHTPPDFDGFDDVEANATAISTLLSASAWRMWTLVNLDAIAANSAASYSNDCLVTDSGAFWGVFVRNNAGTHTVYAYQWDGAEKFASTTATLTGAWVLIQARYDGSNIRLKVNSTSVVTGAAGSISTTTGTLSVGARDSAGNGPSNGRMAELGLLASAGSDADFDDIRTYVNARYGLSL